MEMPLGITIEKIVVKVKLATNRTDNIRAFGELLFYAEGYEEPIFKVKGFTIRSKEFDPGKAVLTVVFPAFPSKFGLKTSFIAENKSLWSDINDLFLRGFKETSGELGGEEIDFEEISKEIDNS